MSFAQVASPVAYQLPLERIGETVAQLPVDRHGDKLPLRMRTALIVGSAAGLWAVVLVAGYYIASALI
jgi:hypothetical protein